ncbi:MAG: acetylglutamate kinase [Armatimonadetes bacterium CG07_land_8_20_14_0_80_40_9]|nr:MAG: acetylglutamate kinase [Armatimonadetes bacterium CG07_land_8_20_14_0_80_40_9]
MTKYPQRAKILIEALPYIKKFFGKFLVIKYGGKAMVNEELKLAVLEDIILLKLVGMNPVLVHGGGERVTQEIEKKGKKAIFFQGLRVTDKESLKIVVRVLEGINKEIVSSIKRLGGKAVGLNGRKESLIKSKKLTSPSNLGFVGEVSKVKTRIIKSKALKGFIPVISSLGIGSDGQTYNINADLVAASLSSKLKADKLIILTDVKGVYKDFPKKELFLSTLSLIQAKKIIAEGKVNKGMIPKLKACIQALESGVSRCHILEGRVPHILLVELFTDKGMGTMITN